MSEMNAIGAGDLQGRLEALLFVAGEPLSAQQLAEALECKSSQVEAGLHILTAYYQQHQRGLAVQHSRGKYQLTTAAEHGSLIERFLGLEATSKFSQAALETLTIVCYRQPITRPGIDAIRGVSSDGVLRSLVSKGLVEEIGRAEGPGRPILYGTTNEFLEHFGLSSLAELPAYSSEEEVDKNGSEPGSGSNNHILKD